MASILVLDPDETWRRELTRSLSALGHQAIPAASWVVGVERMLRSRPELLVLAPSFPELPFRELCRFLRAQTGRGPSVLLRLPASPDSRPQLKARAHTLMGVEGTLAPELSVEEASQVVASLAASIDRRPRRVRRHRSRADLVVLALGEPLVELRADLRAAGLRVVEAVDLPALTRILDSLDHEGPVLLGEAVLGEDPAGSLLALRKAAPDATPVVIGQRGSEEPTPDLSEVRWLFPSSPREALVSAALLAGARLATVPPVPTQPPRAS